jgi:hypothetical protein
MPSQWFTKKLNEDKRGPFSDKELKDRVCSGELLATDLVWREGMPQAVPALKLKGLFPKTQPVTPPPLPSTMVDPNSFDALVSGLVPIQSNAAYTPNSTVKNSDNIVSKTGQDAGKRVEEKEEDIFTWYRPGDSRAPITVNWVGFWQLVHSIGSKNKAFYFLLPIIVAVPLGFVLGMLTSLIPFFFINWIGLFVVCIGFGEAIFQCFRLAGINVKLFSMGYGFLIGLLVCYFFLAGGLFTDYNRNAEKDDPPLGFRTVLPENLIWYINTKAETMSVGKIHQIMSDNAPRPNRFFNYIFIFADLFIIVMMVSAGSGGGRQNVQNNKISNEPAESEDDQIVKKLGIGRF